MNIVVAITIHSDTKRRHNNYVYVIYTKQWEILSVITESQTVCAVCTILYQKKHGNIFPTVSLCYDCHVFIIWMHSYSKLSILNFL